MKNLKGRFLESQEKQSINGHMFKNAPKVCVYTSTISINGEPKRKICSWCGKDLQK